MPVRLPTSTAGKLALVCLLCLGLIAGLGLLLDAVL